MRVPIPVETQVAVDLYYLSDEGRMRKTANAFGIATCTVSVIVRRVNHAISLYLAPIFIKLPQTEEEVKESAGSFFNFMDSLNASELSVGPTLPSSNKERTL